MAAAVAASAVIQAQNTRDPIAVRYLSTRMTLYEKFSVFFFYILRHAIKKKKMEGNFSLLCVSFIFHTRVSNWLTSFIFALCQSPVCLLCVRDIDFSEKKKRKENEVEVGQMGGGGKKRINKVRTRPNFLRSGQGLLLRCCFALSLSCLMIISFVRNISFFISSFNFLLMSGINQSMTRVTNDTKFWKTTTNAKRAANTCQ